MIIAHLPSGYLMAVALLRRIRRVKPSAVVAAGIAGAGAPDLDMFYFHFVDHGKVHHHQYLTHWPVLWLALLAAALLWNRWHASRAALLLGIFALGGVLHLVLDTLVGDVWWLMPWVNEPYAFFTVTARHQPWWLNFLLHWSFAVELAICAWAALLYRARRRSRNASPDTCHVCGAGVDAVLDGQAWCAGCLHIQGSCCGE